MHPLHIRLRLDPVIECIIFSIVVATLTPVLHSDIATANVITNIMLICKAVLTTPASCNLRCVATFLLPMKFNTWLASCQFRITMHVLF